MCANKVKGKLTWGVGVTHHPVKNLPASPNPLDYTQSLNRKAPFTCLALRVSL